MTLMRKVLVRSAVFSVDNKNAPSLFANEDEEERNAETIAAEIRGLPTELQPKAWKLIKELSVPYGSYGLTVHTAEWISNFLPNCVHSWAVNSLCTRGFPRLCFATPLSWMEKAR